MLHLPKLQPCLPTKSKLTLMHTPLRLCTPSPLLSRRCLCHRSTQYSSQPHSRHLIWRLRSTLHRSTRSKHATSTLGKPWLTSTVPIRRLTGALPGAPMAHYTLQFHHHDCSIVPSYQRITFIFVHCKVRWQPASLPLRRLAYFLDKFLGVFLDLPSSRSSTRPRPRHEER